MSTEPTKPIAEGDNTAVETTTVGPGTENTATQDEAPTSEEEPAAQLGDFA